MACVDKLIRLDMICPLSGKKLKESDIILIVRVSSLLTIVNEVGGCGLSRVSKVVS